MSENSVLLNLHGASYRFDILKQVSAAGPKIEVKEDEINDAGIDANPNHIVTAMPGNVATPSNEIIFVKQDGKYTVMAGHGQMELQKAHPKFKGVYVGRLVSSVALKKAKVVEDTPEEVEQPKAAPAYDERFANRPRVTTGRKPYKTPFGTYDSPRKRYG